MTATRSFAQAFVRRCLVGATTAVLLASAPPRAIAAPCEPPDASCPLFFACNELTNECEVVEFDPDNDGLSDGADPCPHDPRNLCVGPVAVDSGAGLPLRLNASVSADECSGAKLDCNGDAWAGDFGFNKPDNAGACNLGGGGELCEITGIAAIFGCEDEETEDLFQCEHSDKAAAPELAYSFNVPNSRYLVNLYFANTYDLTAAPAQRLFDVFVEGTLAFDDFDQVTAAGGSGIAVVRSVDMTVNDGNGLQIDFVHELENPAIKAIEVLQFGCNVDADCDDDNDCTDDDCVAGDCSFEPNTEPCNDGLACTSDDECADAICTGESDCPQGQTCSAQSGICDAPAISFAKSQLLGSSLDQPTSLQLGPDGRLYVAQQSGLIHAYTVDRLGPGDYVVAATEVIDLVQDIANHDDDGDLNGEETTRLVTGLLVTGTAVNPVIYVASGDPRVGGGPTSLALNLDTNSGVVSRIAWNGSAWQRRDLVRGLPRSEENHTGNGMALDVATNTLYLAIGGNTNMGAPSNNFVFLPEYALSAAILSIDLDAIGDAIYDLPTLDDEDTPNLCSAPATSFGLACDSDSECDSSAGADDGVCDLDAKDPFGGNDGKNQAKLVPGGPVAVHAPGFRNPYDVLITQSGRMYSIDNGSNAGWGDIPIGEGTPNCTNGTSEPGPSEWDNLHFIPGPGFYGGHPNPTRANTANTFNASNPQSPVAAGNPVECDARAPGIEDGALATFKRSTNGLTEYTATNFGGQMVGDLLATSFDNQIWRIVLNAAGTTATSFAPLFSTVGSKPLDIVAHGPSDPYPGTIWVADYFFDRITIFEPSESGLCTGVDDPGLDEDGDQFDNADEIDNGNDPCSSADFPADADADFVSDLTDLDDDNDGFLDTSDKFALDAANGTSTPFPLLYGWENSEPARGGILDLGFTGVMTNGVSDYLSLFDTDKMTAGGAAGVTTVDEPSAGDALGALDSQEYGFQFGAVIPADAPSKLTVHTRVVGPFLGQTPIDFQSLGLFVGNGDQDNYFKVAVSANAGVGGVECVLEVDGVATPGPVATVAMPGPEAIDLAITIDRATSSAQAAYSVTTDGQHGAVTLLGAPVLIPPAWLSDPTSGLAVGIVSTSRGAGAFFPATWDFIEISNGPAFCNEDADCADTNGCTDDVCTAGACSNEASANGSECADALACTIDDVCNAGVCGGTDDCDAGEACNAETGSCGSVPGDPDNDGLAEAADPCPLDARNRCFGSVAIDDATSKPIRLNANVSGAECAGAKVDCSGQAWEADFGYNLAARAVVCDLGGGGEACVIGGIDAVFGCNDEQTEDLFQCEHSDASAAPELAYSFDVPSGSYVVNLYFANTFTGTATGGSRVFDIAIEGAIAYADFDQIVAAGGSGIAVVRSKVVDVVDGDGLQIELLHGVEHPALKALEVLAEGGVTTTTTTTTSTTTSTTTTTTVRLCSTLSDCNDENPCTFEACVDGRCAFGATGAGLPCADDGNVCTDDVCGNTGDCTHPANHAPCDDRLFCTQVDACNLGACSGAGNPCGVGQTCEESGDSCDAGICVAVIPGTTAIRCYENRACTVPIALDDDGFDVKAAGATVASTLELDCAPDCVSGTAATNGACGGESEDCDYVVGDITGPASAFDDGELARIQVTCREPGTDEICLTAAVATLVDGSPASSCDPVCVSFECGDCASGDCDASGSSVLDANDATCTAQCIAGTPPPGADCSCAADCNCTGGVEASDGSCVVLRAADAFATDPCLSGTLGGGFVAADAAVEVGKPKVLGQGARKRVFVRLDGEDADSIGSIRVGLFGDGAIGRIQLARRLRLAGFSLRRARAGRDHAVAVVSAPLDGASVKSMSRGRVLRVILKGATPALVLSGAQLGSTSGLPISTSDENPP